MCGKMYENNQMYGIFLKKKYGNYIYIIKLKKYGNN